MGKYDTKYKLKYDRFYFRNRWSEPDYMREDNWTFVGIGMRYSGPERVCYKISFFGLDFSFWFDRIKKGKVSKNFHSEFLMKHYD